MSRQRVTDPGDAGSRSVLAGRLGVAVVGLRLRNLHLDAVGDRVARVHDHLRSGFEPSEHLCLAAVLMTEGHRCLLRLPVTNREDGPRSPCRNSALVGTFSTSRRSQTTMRTSTR